MQEAVVDLRLLADGFDKRHDALPQGVEKGIQLLLIQAALVLVQQGVIGSLFGVVVPGKFPVVIHQFLQHRAERSKVIVFLGLVPDVAGAVGQLAVGHIFVRRDAVHLLTAAVQLFHFPPVELVQRFLFRVQVRNEGLRLRAGHQLLVLSGQNAQSHAAALSGVFRGHRHGIQIERAFGAVERIQLFLQHFQLGDLFGLIHRVLLFQSCVGKAAFFQKIFRRVCGSGSGISNSYRSVALMTMVFPWLHTRGSFAS